MFPTDCHDNIYNCKGYGRAICIDPTYDSWLTDKCASFCISIDKNRRLLLFLLFS